MVRVNKRVARKAWNEGKGIIILPCKMNPRSPWFKGIMIKKSDFESLGYDTDFDKIVNQHEYYNCTNNEVGRYCAFYMEEE